MSIGPPVPYDVERGDRGITTAKGSRTMNGAGDNGDSVFDPQSPDRL